MTLFIRFWLNPLDSMDLYPVCGFSLSICKMSSKCPQRFGQIPELKGLRRYTFSSKQMLFGGVFTRVATASFGSVGLKETQRANLHKQHLWAFSTQMCH